MPTDPLCVAGNVAGAAHNVKSGLLDQWKDGVLEGQGKMIAWLGTFWVDVDTPPVIVPGTVDTATVEVSWLQGQLWWYTLVLAIFGVLIGAGRLVWEQRNEPLKQMMTGLIRFVLVTGSGVAVIQLLITGFDELAKALLHNSTNGTGFATNISVMLGLNGSLGSLLIIIFGVISLLAALVQLVMMIFRSGILQLLCGALPTSAAFTNTETGRAWFQRFVAWIIAFLLYKPAAALCYALAFKLTGANVFADDGNGGVKIITGLSLMLLSLVALPALMRLVTPMVAAAANGGGGAAALGAMAGSVASGAVNRGMSGGGGRSGGQSNSTTESNSTSTNTSKKEENATGATSTPSQSKGPATSGAGTTAGTGAATATGAGTGAGAAGAGAAGAGAGAAAGAAGGPVGMAAAAGAQVLKKGAEAVQKAADSATGEGPSGSKG
ncbi:hypothetical protein [Paenarthrobacter histidinolovorans]|uniref:Type IV secretion system protein TrbL n=1 Tax=Paenarthrobacter histidinolovorans TaxID=43664 RepID=A0ABW8MZD3_9MICC